MPVTSDEAKQLASELSEEQLVEMTAELGPTQREGPDVTREQIAARAARDIAAEIKLAQRREFIKKPVEERSFPPMNVERERVAFGQQYNAVISTMTSRERDAVAFYTGNDYMSINRYLRVGQENPEYYVHKSTKREIADLSGLLDRTVVPTDVTSYRGTGRISTINMAYEAGQLTPGTNITDRGFLSTSLDEAVAKRFQAQHGGVILQIEVPKGSNGLYVGMRAPEGTPNRYRSSISSVQDESELLMQKGRTLKVLSVETVEGVAYVKVRLH